MIALLLVTLNCGHVAGPPAPQIGQIRATGTSCRVARHLARSWRAGHTPRGWRCSTHVLEPGYPTAHTRCYRGRARVRWTDA